MNYWPRWINAITNKTAHLSLAEMGAYDRLLDHYYKTEKPLPGDLEACCRIVRAIGKADHKAVQSVLAQFFVLEDGNHTQERAEAEILLAAPKIAAAKANGGKGGRPKGSKNKPTGFPEGTQEEPASKAPHPHPHKPNTDDLPDPRAGAGEEASGPDLSAFTPTPAGAICKTLKTAGIWDVNPGNVRLTMLLQAGATEAEFLAMVPAAKGKDGPFGWLLAALTNERQRAAEALKTMPRGAMPPKGQGARPTGAHTGFENKDYTQGVNADGSFA
jgi:uncharacterized protein YdaU (DUF1376 family)